MASSRSSADGARSARTRDTVEVVIAELRRMIHDGRLLPGEKIHQDTLADELGVSRIPVREALKTLTADGLVQHTMNAGFRVTRLNSAEFDQLYRMRRLLETEVVLAMRPPGTDELTHLRALNEAVAQAAAEPDIPMMMRHNRELHFTIFRISGLDLIVKELERLWDLAMPYQSLFVYDIAARTRVVREHDAIVEALGTGDSEHAAALMDSHRNGPQPQMSWLLGSTPGGSTLNY